MLSSYQGYAGPGLLAGVFERKGTNMYYTPVTKKSLFAAVVCALLATAPAKATIYDEAVSGDLSNNQLAPTALTLTPGANSVIGTVNGFPPGTDAQDWVSFTIPTGFVMTSYVNSKYDSTDDQGFTGFQFGSSFSGDPFVAGSYAGYAHFGFEATNPDGTPPKSTIGVDLLPLMANPSFAPGTTGFTPPLHAGTYTFLIQQGDPVTTNYQFDMNVRSVQAPEPGSSLFLLSMGGLAILALRRRLGYLDRRIR
jgi:PEP-CTERM motif